MFCFVALNTLDNVGPLRGPRSSEKRMSKAKQKIAIIGAGMGDGEFRSGFSLTGLGGFVLLSLKIYDSRM